MVIDFIKKPKEIFPIMTCNIPRYYLPTSKTVSPQCVIVVKREELFGKGLNAKVNGLAFVIYVIYASTSWTIYFSIEKNGSSYYLGGCSAYYATIRIPYVSENDVYKIWLWSTENNTLVSTGYFYFPYSFLPSGFNLPVLVVPSSGVFYAPVENPFFNPPVFEYLYRNVTIGSNSILRGGVIVKEIHTDGGLFWCELSPSPSVYSSDQGPYSPTLGNFVLLEQL